ncbi:MAG: HAMP domain-containing histidine kinase [Actinobacteria bacterium]|nr:HAMP domain-containing histidine kinase [Actinomycetota bacterium]
MPPEPRPAARLRPFGTRTRADRAAAAIHGAPPAFRWPVKPPGLRWPHWPGSIRWPFAWVDVAWACFSLANLAAMVVFSHWETVPFHFIWISLTLLYGFRVWAIRPTLVVLGVVIVTTFGAIAWDVHLGAQSVDELNEVPLMAAMFWLMVWHSQRRLAADAERALVSEENSRLLATQRRFLQDASHQLRTPITIALGHSELLARELAGRREGRDIEVVVGELARLRRLGERLLVIAGSEDPDFLRPEPVALDQFAMEVLRKWVPTAQRRWQFGTLDSAVVSADLERLGLAVDALLENAVRHTSDGDLIQLSVVADGTPGWPRMIVADSGRGIAPADLEHIFDRFRTVPPADGSRGTGLGLALVRAVADAHGGDVLVRSVQGAGSEFELVLPAAAPPGDGLPGAAPLAHDRMTAAARTLLEDRWKSGTR